MKSQKFTLNLLLEAKENLYNYTDSLQLQITPSVIVIATTQNERVEGGNYKKSVKVIKVMVAKM